MSYFWKYFSSRLFRASPQELHLLPQFLGDFGQLNLYNKVSVRRIIIYEAIFMLGFISNQFNLVVVSEVLQGFFQKTKVRQSFVTIIVSPPSILGLFWRT